MKKTSLFLSFCVVLTVLFSCSKGNSTSGGTNNGGGGTTVDCSTINAKFNADVLPIIQGSCAITGCHNGTQSPRLTTYDEIAANASIVNSQVQSGIMPKTGSLTTSQKNIIICWVQSGALNN
ncbi:MAG: hypothetical protein HYR66_18605 [Sphingobacteriales bacterium]|nr:hypothetical protein [Sphingobacteriales bacterium]MBI3720562.1 hypothetical protein [Sphingobacteriales bacterium]